MFYKNKSYYESTLKTIVREEFDVDLFFEGRALKFIEWLYHHSDREKYLCYGYDFLIWSSYKCFDYEEFLQTFGQLKECYLDQGEFRQLCTELGISKRKEILK